MGRESRNNATAQDAREGKLIFRASMMGRIDSALENHALAIRVALQKIETLEARIAALENIQGPVESYPPGFLGPEHTTVSPT